MLWSWYAAPEQRSLFDNLSSPWPGNADAVATRFESRRCRARGPPSAHQTCNNGSKSREYCTANRNFHPVGPAFFHPHGGKIQHFRTPFVGPLPPVQNSIPGQPSTSANAARGPQMQNPSTLAIQTVLPPAPLNSGAKPRTRQTAESPLAHDQQPHEPPLSATRMPPKQN
jgi:hypothetical protein